MADNKAVNQTAAKPEEAKADKKAKANDGKKKVPFTAKVKNFFGRITKYFRDTKSELKKVVWPIIEYIAELDNSFSLFNISCSF